MSGDLLASGRVGHLEGPRPPGPSCRGPGNLVKQISGTKGRTTPPRGTLRPPGLEVDSDVGRRGRCRRGGLEAALAAVRVQLLGELAPRVLVGGAVNLGSLGTVGLSVGAERPVALDVDTVLEAVALERAR